MVLSSSEVEYVALALGAKNIIWTKLLLIEIGLPDKNSQYAMIKIARSPRIDQIKAVATEQEEEVVNTLSSITLNITSIAPTPIYSKDNNQKSIALAYNPIFHTHTKYIDI